MGGRTAFIIDGFNVYHSVVAASRSLGLPDERGTKWLNLRGLCESYLPALGADATCTGIYYFSALAHYMQAAKPGVAARHQAYIRALNATEVVVELGHFKKKSVTCNSCSKTINLREEKETDVAVGVKLLEVLHDDVADRVVLVTGDTDIAPAVRAAGRMFPSREVCFAFPWGRKNDELARCVERCFQITREAYVRHQFPDPLIVGKRKLTKPPSW
ncbi:MAG TPA: NYN domain-containing protein [Thermoanaerobaculia bacterium]|jgi:uncharacterized LabA/DUF88 family protein|nr:NYN domain-containing protein [Thermoanaerobaculia bacterium]